MQWDENDIDSMALCCWRESRGEGLDGMVAVAHVIFNRASTWYQFEQDPIHVCVYAKNQFTSMSVTSDPQYNLMPDDGDLAYADIRAKCYDVVKVDLPDPTGGAKYYANLATMNSPWFDRNICQKPAQHPQTVVIGRHTFFK